MTDLYYADGEMHVRFPGWEAAMAGRRTFAVPDTAIIGARAEPGWTSEVLGIRSGLVVSGFRKLGTFIHPNGTRRLVSMTRGLPLLRVALDREATGFDELLVSTADAEAVAAALRTGVS